MCIQNKRLVACKEALVGVEMAEIRMDLTELNEKEVEELFSSAVVPLVATCRYDNMSDEDRMILLKAAIRNGAAFVDLEIEAASDFKVEMANYAREYNCRIIISYHNYDATPAKETLQMLIDQCFREGADIAKLATSVKKESESARLMGLYENNSSIVVLGMGDKGKITRLAATVVGAPFTFAAKDIETATAPGQLTQDELKRIYDII